MPPDRSDASAIVSGLLKYLSSCRRMHLLPEIISRLQSVLNHQNNVVRVISAVKLSPPDQTEILRRLQDQFHFTDSVDFSVDSTLIGGLKVIIGDQVIDLSVKARLDQIYAQ